MSIRDVQRQAVALPCVLGLRHKHTKGIKHTLALPPSAATSWGGRVRWEVAVVQAFGATFPQLDAERAAASIGTELLEAVAEARRDGDPSPNPGPNPDPNPNPNPNSNPNPNPNPNPNSRTRWGTRSGGTLSKGLSSRYSTPSCASTIQRGQPLLTRI